MKNLSKAIDEKGISRAEICRRTGISKKQLYNYENGISEATESKIKAICEILEVSSDYIIGIKENEKKEE